MAVGSAGLRGTLGRRADRAPTTRRIRSCASIFDTRVYNDGTARVDVTVENVLDLAGATTVTYDVTTARQRQRRVHEDRASQHYYLTRWRKVFDRRRHRSPTITPDLAPFNARECDPAVPVARPQSDQHADGCDLRDPACGRARARTCRRTAGRQEIAPYPDWTARYLVHKDLDAARVRARQRRPLGLVAGPHARARERHAHRRRRRAVHLARSSARRSGSTIAPPADRLGLRSSRHAAADARVRERSSRARARPR